MRSDADNAISSAFSVVLETKDDEGDFTGERMISSRRLSMKKNTPVAFAESKTL